jgi:hypothetical protein
MKQKLLPIIEGPIQNTKDLVELSEIKEEQDLDTDREVPSKSN